MPYGPLIRPSPAGHLVYEAHQYFDSDHSGTYTSSYDAEGAYPTVGVDDLQPYAAWLTQHGYKGWVGEYGVPNNDTRWLTVLNNFIAALKSDGIWGTYWAGGPWWGNYTLSCEPTNGQDAVQMSILDNYPSS
jgi:endoglucanase